MALTLIGAQEKPVFLKLCSQLALARPGLSNVRVDPRILAYYSQSEQEVHDEKKKQDRAGTNMTS
jgi:hypothetical protein